MTGRYECCGTCEYKELDYIESRYKCGNGSSENYGHGVLYEDLCGDYEEKESDKEHSKRRDTRIPK